MPTRREIDQLDQPRKKPMRVLVLGLPRTGTMSICAALRRLGYTAHNMATVMRNPKTIPLWNEAINVTLVPAKERPWSQRKMEPYGREEFDKLLGDYDALTDVPSVLFAKQLVEAYPEAKVILTIRDYQGWEESMRESIWCLFTWRLFDLCRIFNLTNMAPIMHLTHSIFRVHNNNNYGGPDAKAAFNKHNATVREIVPKDRLLEFGPDDTWEPLCNFLGEKVPEGVEYPQVNESKDMQKNLTNAWWGIVQYLMLMVLLPTIVTAGGVALWVYGDHVWAIRDAILASIKETFDM